MIGFFGHSYEFLKVPAKKREKSPRGGILHLQFALIFDKLLAMYCENCDNTDIQEN